MRSKAYRSVVRIPPTKLAVGVTESLVYTRQHLLLPDFTHGYEPSGTKGGERGARCLRVRHAAQAIVGYTLRVGAQESAHQVGRRIFPASAGTAYEEALSHRDSEGTPCQVGEEIDDQFPLLHQVDEEA